MHELWRLLRADAAQYASRDGWAHNIGFWIGATHRLTEWARDLPQPARRYAILLPGVALTKFWRAAFGVHIMEGAAFGPGLCLPHARSMMIGRVHVGGNCLIADHVTIGTNANSADFATIGNHVEINSGTRILGHIQIGDGARIGANAVVTRNIPAGAEVHVVASRTLPHEKEREA
jgi:serine acetyltransferase